MKLRCNSGHTTGDAARSGRGGKGHRRQQGSYKPPRKWTSLPHTAGARADVKDVCGCCFLIVVVVIVSVAL